MASLPHRYTTKQQDALQAEDIVAVIDAAEFEEAQRDPRVRTFLEEADEYLADLERQGRNR
jgi:hypothetical protein